MAQQNSGFQFQILVSSHFQKSMRKIRSQQLKKRIYEYLIMLAKGFQDWRSLTVKKIEMGDPSRSVRSVRVNDLMRILFEGPFDTKRFGPTLFIHNVCTHDEYLWKIKLFAKSDQEEQEFHEIELTDEEMTKKGKGIDSETAVFSKLIPIKALLTPERIDAILNSNKANMLLTQKQMEVLSSDRPLLIHGQAGSGKTTLLCHRLALSVLSRRTQQTGRLVFISYNEKLVKQAERDTEEILREQHNFKKGLEGVEFKSLPIFMKQYVPNPSRFKPENYVPFGRFKQHYEIYRRGNPTAKRISCEVAWHGIRSILKGACLPPSFPPLSRDAYDSLARKRREFPHDIFDDIYNIGLWYQRELIQKHQLWDDQDLAWTALNWIMIEKEKNEKMLLYDEIFCDEGQDLTEIEFRVLVSLCRQPLIGAKEGLQLAFAGDPLQTINPTGFRWSIIGNDVYNVQGKPVRLQQLQENFRSDKRIVDFANRIQKIRSYYMGQTAVEQDAFEKDGEIPQIIVADSAEEIAIVQKKLAELPPESAVIVWADDNDEVSQLYKTEQILSTVDHNLNLYSVSEAKGLEFRLVVLYKFGSSREAVNWKNCLAEEKKISLEDEIPLLYFLNRLYVAVTRAKSFLLVVDTKSGVDDFWSIWKNAVYFMPRAEIRSLLDTHPALRAEVSDEAWRQWAETLFDRAERTRDIRLYERARRAFEKANEIQSVSRIDARLLEIREQWQDAGKKYFDINEFDKARFCYDRAENWGEAYKASTMLPTTPKTKRYVAVYKFKMSRKEKLKNANIEFYEYALTDNELDRGFLDELGTALLRDGDNSRAAQIFSIIAQRSGDKSALVQAAKSFFEAGSFEYAERLFREAGETKVREYHLSRAENLLRNEDFLGAARLFSENEVPERVIKIYELLEFEKRTFPKKQLLELTADSYFKLERYERALSAYKSLLTELGKAQDSRIIGQVGECLEKLGDKSGAYDRYREACLYKKAADLGVELGVPDEEIISLRTREAMENNDFEKAARLAKNSDDEKIVHMAAGQHYSHKRDFVKAIPEFMKAEMWKETLDSIIQARTQAGGGYSEEFIQSCDFLVAVARYQDTFDRDVKDQIMRIVGQVEDNPSWESHVQPSEMGKVYEKCAYFGEAARYYKSRPEGWARDGWLRVKYAQLDSFKKRRELDNAAQIEREIFLTRAEAGGMNLEDEFYKEHIEILRETDKVKNNQELSTREKNAQYVATVAYYLQKYVPANLKLVKPPFIADLPMQFSLLLVKEDSLSVLAAGVPSYKLEDITVAIEVRGHGWVEKADELEDAIKRKKDCFDGIKAKNKGMKCLYLTLEERRKTKDGTSYHALSKKFLGSDYFSLRDSTTKMMNPHEWENFVHSMVQP